MTKQRLDLYLVEQGLVPSRSMAQSVIMAGEVYVNQQKASKAGELVTGSEQIELRSKTLRYVSRGGLKLDKAMAVTKSVWILGLLQADSPIVCCRMEPCASIPLMWAMVSSPGNFGRIPGWSIWSVPISVM